MVEKKMQERFAPTLNPNRGMMIQEGSCSVQSTSHSEGRLVQIEDNGIMPEQDHVSIHKYGSEELPHF